MAKKAYAVKIDPDLHDAAVEVLESLGTTFSNAINMFLQEVVNKKGLPLELQLPRNADEDEGKEITHARK